MGTRSKLKRLGARLGRALYLLGRPARGDRGQGGMVIQAYRGVAFRDEVLLMGRAFRQQRVSPRIREGKIARDLADIARRILRHGAPGVTLRACFGGAEQQVTTDRDGYFRVDLRLGGPVPSEHLWQRLHLEIPGGDGPSHAAGAFFLPPATARFGVISDIDDTVIFTGVANKITMLWRLFFQGAKDRVAFPGVAAFYRGLHRGESGEEFNPMLYVSRSPWGLYEILEEFFHLHDIPAGPILFLREWGISLRRPFPRRAKEHKLLLIRRMLALSDGLPFILIGDSGQRDPEIYARIVRDHPGRIRAVYIRHVSGESRQRAIEKLTREVVAAGSTLVLAKDTFAMAEHAAAHGFLSQDGVSAVLAEKARAQATDRHPTRRVRGTAPEETRGGLENRAILETLSAEGESNVVVDAGAKEKDPPPPHPLS